MGKEGGREEGREGYACDNGGVGLGSCAVLGRVLREVSPYICDMQLYFMISYV